MRSVMWACAALAASALSPHAMAASDLDRQDCNSDNPALMIRGCTRLIEDPGETTANRALALYKRGLGYITRGETDRAIADYDEAIKLTPGNGLTFNERGIAYRAKGDFDRAIADFDQAITLDSGNADIYYNRGHARLNRGEPDRAVADFDEAIKLGSKNVIAVTKDEEITRLAAERINADYYGARGHAEFLLSRFDAAAADYGRFVRIFPDNPYTVLWLYLARARSGQQSGAAELQSNAAALKPTDWPFPVVELFLGRRTAEATLAAASKPEERCEANYYVGEWYLLRGDGPAALAAHKGAADTCSKESDEYLLARGELRRPGK